MRRALVTGGNRGIGAAIAEGLAAAGLEVIVGARVLAEGAAVARRIGGRAVALDLEDPESLTRAVAEIGDLDVLVNNAGVLGAGPVLGEGALFETSMAVMVAGPHALMRAFVPGMEARGYGRVVNVSSGWGSFDDGLEGPGAYGVAKAALNALTLAASRDTRGEVKINAMCPGWVRTRMGGAGADLTPEEGAETGIWLATLPADGPMGGFFRQRERIAW